jgi:cytochrome d ubiquinol oxidase subunit I
MEFNPDTVRHEMVDFWALVFNPTAVSKFFHTVFSGWMTGAVFVMGISCWYLLKRREVRFALGSIRVATVVGILGTLAVIVSGDSSGVHMAQYQPMKLAAAEGLENGGNGVGFSIVPCVEVPYMLSALATHDIDGYVPGVNDLLEGYTDNDGISHLSAEEKMKRGKVALEAFKEYRKLKDSDTEGAALARKTLDENIEYFGYGYIESKEELIPPTDLVYWAFRAMVGIGSFLLLLMIVMLWAERKKRLTGMRWLQWIAFLSIPLVYLAGQAGWVVAEVGRQPWAIEGLLPVKAAVSSVSTENVKTTFFLFVAIFTLFLIIELRILVKAIKEGPKSEN